MVCHATMGHCSAVCEIFPKHLLRNMHKGNAYFVSWGRKKQMITVASHERSGVNRQLNSSLRLTTKKTTLCIISSLRGNPPVDAHIQRYDNITAWKQGHHPTLTIYGEQQLSFVYLTHISCLPIVCPYTSQHKPTSYDGIFPWFDDLTVVPLTSSVCMYPQLKRICRTNMYTVDTTSIHKASTTTCQQIRFIGGQRCR